VTTPRCRGIDTAARPASIAAVKSPWDFPLDFGARRQGISQVEHQRSAVIAVGESER
jgi:hypothetical protein